MRRKRHLFLLASGLQRSVKLLRNGGLLEKNQFPEIQGPITIVITPKKGRSPIVRFIAKIRVKSNFNLDTLWLRFNRRGSSVYISEDRVHWKCINSFKD